MSRAEGRLLEVDALRGLAALAVMLFHYSTRFESLFGHSSELSWSFPHGFYGVNLFFMISGFVILMTLARTRRPMDFVVSRFSRLFPAYWVAVLLAFAVTSLAGLPGKTVGLGDALLNLTMVHTWFDRPLVDNVYWTLGVEMIFYVQAFTLFVTGQIRRFPLLILALLALRLGYFLAERLWGVALPFLAFRFLLLGFIPYFGLGVALFRCHQRGRGAVEDAIVIAASLLTVALVESVSAALVSAALFAVFALAVGGRLAVLRRAPLVWLGTISYPLYLLHENIGWCAIRTLEALGVGSDLAVLAALLLALGLASMLHYAVEAPAMMAIRRAWRARFVEVAT
ncbi:acyltransferase family protein [Niveibacterium terrae]|uniref:acyltransferase family protein n=1 Tax=Niveibacterium terrae TaxID=3373598 RepID=UPI003A939A16